MRLPSLLACFAGNHLGPSKRRRGGQEQPPAASAALKEITNTYFNLMALADSPRTCPQARVSHHHAQDIGTAAPAAPTTEALAFTTNTTTPSQNRALSANTSSSVESDIHSAPMPRTNVSAHTANPANYSPPTAAPPPTAQSTHMATTVTTTDQQRHKFHAINTTTGLQRRPTQMLYFPTSLRSSLQCNSAHLDCSPSTPIARLAPHTPTRHIAPPQEQQHQQQRQHHRPQDPNNHLQQPMQEQCRHLYRERQQQQQRQQQEQQQQPDAAARLHQLHQRLNGIVTINRQSYNSVIHAVRIVEDALLAVPESCGGGGGGVDTCVARLEGIVQQLEAAVVAAEREWCGGVAAAVRAAQMYDSMYGVPVQAKRLETQCDSVWDEALGKQGWEVGRRRRLPQAVVVPGQGPALVGAAGMLCCAQHHQCTPYHHQDQREELVPRPGDQCGQSTSDMRCCDAVQYGKELAHDKGVRTVPYIMEEGDRSWGSRTAGDGLDWEGGGAVEWGEELAGDAQTTQQQQQQVWRMQVWVEEQLRQEQEQQQWVLGLWRVQQWVEQQQQQREVEVAQATAAESSAERMAMAVVRARSWS